MGSLEGGWGEHRFAEKGVQHRGEQGKVDGSYSLADVWEREW